MQTSRKKFKGWVGRHSAIIGHLVGMRKWVHVNSKPLNIKDSNLERIVYTGCIHGGNNDVFERLEKLAQNPPDYLIFTGDITGTAEMEKLKKYFYDKKEENNNSIFKRYEYFGHWAAILPREERERLLVNLQKNAENLLRIIQKIKKQGTKIYFLEGNWDNPEVSGIKVLAGKDIHNVFDIPAYFKNHGFKFINKISTLKTETTFHILLPFITLLRFDEVNKKQIHRIQKEIEIERERGKIIIIIGHAEANWRMHHLTQKNSRALGERGMVIHNFGRAMALFAPDEVIYPHQHARIRDEKGNLINIDSKYLLQVTDNGVRLVDDPKSVNEDKKQILVSYVPLGYLAEEDSLI